MPTSGPRRTPATRSRSGAGGLACLVVLAALAADLPAAGGAAGCFREDFDSLERWRPLTFPKVRRHSTYEIVRQGDGGVLRASSDASASGVLLQGDFDVYECPRVRWRWKADGTYERGDARSRSGDDYPLRLYILFPFDPGRASLAERLRYGAAKLLYGGYPPRRALNYIWSSRPRERRPLPNAYTDRAMMFPLRGPADAGRWFTEEVDLLRDYREVFGEDPPPKASLAIMNDSDDTGESSVSWVDWIEVSR